VPEADHRVVGALRRVERARLEADLEAEDLAIDEEEEPSADEEVDLSTGDDDLGVEAPADEDEV